MSEAEFIAQITKRDPKRRLARWAFSGWAMALGSIFTIQTLRELLSDHANGLHVLGLIFTLCILFIGLRGVIETLRDHTPERLDLPFSQNEIGLLLDRFFLSHKLRRTPLDANTLVGYGTGFDRIEMLVHMDAGKIIYSIRSAQSGRLD